MKDVCCVKILLGVLVLLLWLYVRLNALREWVGDFVSVFVLGNGVQNGSSWVLVELIKVECLMCSCGESGYSSSSVVWNSIA